MNSEIKKTGYFIKICLSLLVINFSTDLLSSSNNNQELSKRITAYSTDKALEVIFNDLVYGNKYRKKNWAVISQDLVKVIKKDPNFEKSEKLQEFSDCMTNLENCKTFDKIGEALYKFLPYVPEKIASNLENKYVNKYWQYNLKRAITDAIDRQ